MQNSRFMTRRALAVVAGLALAAGASGYAATVIVPGTANPWLAGITTNGFQEANGDVTPDESPVLFTGFSAGDALHFAASGSAGYAPGAESGPLGVATSPVSHGGEDGIGEIDFSPANALIGVFLADSQPDPAGSTPAPLDFMSDDSRSYLVLRPLLLQPFYIGSGINASGVRQTVIAPPGATRLYLGIQDGFGWYNNTGSFTVDITQAQPLPGIGSFAVSPGGVPIRSSNPWTFSAVYSTLVSDLRLRVQSTLTTNSEASWTDLPGNPYMTHVDANWTLNTTDVPTGDQYFRVIASAPGYGDAFSTVVGPFTVVAGIGPLTNFIWQTTPPYRNNEAWTFSISENSTVPGLGLRLQSTATPDTESSWTDLTGGQMSTSDAVTWTLATTKVPLGTVYFRGIASAASYTDRISSYAGPFTIGRGLGDFADGDFQVLETGTPIRSSNPWTFKAHFTNLVSGLRLRVQVTANTNVESSWTDLPGNPYMTMSDYNWTLNTTDVPANVGEYFRVIASAPGYVDSKSVAGPLDVLPGMAPLYNFAWHTAAWPLQTGTNWVFTIDEASGIGGLQLRVQSSTTPDVEASWTDLPGGQMLPEPTNSVTWGVTNSAVPGGNQFFRVVASAPTYEDRISVPLGASIGPPTPVVPHSLSSGQYQLESFPDLFTPIGAFFQNIGSGVMHLVFGNPTTQVNAAVVVGAAQGGSADLIVGPGQKVTAPDLAASTGATMYVSGEIVGNASLIGQDGSGIVAQGAGNIVAQGGGNIVAEGAGNAVSHDGGTVISNDGGTLTYAPTSGGASALRLNGHQPKGPPPQPTFTGQMKVDGNFDQYAGTLLIAVAGTNTLTQGAQQYDQLVVGGTASLLGGILSVGVFNPENPTNQIGVFQPAVGDTFDLVVASNLVVSTAYSVIAPFPGSWSIVTRPDGLQSLRLVVAPPPPTLSYQLMGSIIQLSYPSNYTGYIIQSTPALSPASWTDLSAGTNVITLPITNASLFFRLNKP